MDLNEKYRPQKFEELVGQEHVKSKLEGTSLDEMQHMMFIGPAGTGKTTTAHIIKKEVFDEDNQTMNFKELNASSENSIDDIREKVQRFSKTKPQKASKNVILLDEADNISQSGQQALRRMMERYADSTLFILSGNYEDKFLDPIKSRCAVIHFDKIENEDIAKRLQQIAEDEGIEYNEETIELIAEESHGDIRSAINTFRFAVKDGELGEEVRTKSGEVKEMAAKMINGDYKGAREEKNKLIMKGLEEQKIIELLYEVVKDSDAINDGVKGILIEQFADAEYRMKMDANKALQLDRMIWKVAERIN